MVVNTLLLMSVVDKAQLISIVVEHLILCRVF